jgi:hypothetical protein
MIYTEHIGPISPERQACIDRQKEMYGDEWSAELSGEVTPEMLGMTPEQVRINMDRGRLECIKDGGGWMDSDVWPREPWQPTEDGIWLCHSYGRLDYWAIFNRNRNDYIAEMLEYCDREKPAFIWPLRYFNEHRNEIKLIPSDVLKHLYLTTSKGGKV